jgi:hypothetical protein
MSSSKLLLGVDLGAYESAYMMSQYPSEVHHLFSEIFVSSGDDDTLVMCANKDNIPDGDPYFRVRDFKPALAVARGSTGNAMTVTVVQGEETLVQGVQKQDNVEKQVTVNVTLVNGKETLSAVVPNGFPTWAVGKVISIETVMQTLVEEIWTAYCLKTAIQESDYQNLVVVASVPLRFVGGGSIAVYTHRLTQILKQVFPKEATIATLDEASCAFKAVAQAHPREQVLVVDRGHSTTDILLGEILAEESHGQSLFRLTDSHGFHDAGKQDSEKLLSLIKNENVSQGLKNRSVTLNKHKIRVSSELSTRPTFDFKKLLNSQVRNTITDLPITREEWNVEMNFLGRYKTQEMKSLRRKIDRRRPLLTIFTGNGALAYGFQRVMIEDIIRGDGNFTIQNLGAVETGTSVVRGALKHAEDIVRDVPQPPSLLARHIGFIYQNPDNTDRSVECVFQRGTQLATNYKALHGFEINLPYKENGAFHQYLAVVEYDAEDPTQPLPFDSLVDKTVMDVSVELKGYNPRATNDKSLQ